MNLIERLVVGVEADMSKFDSGLQGTQSKLSQWGSSLTSAGMAASVAVSAPLMAIGKKFTDMAMNAIESENLVAVTFGEYLEDIKAWSDELQTSLGLSGVQLRKQAGMLFTMFKSMGVVGPEAAEMSKQLSMLAYDMASFYNLDPEEAFHKLRSGIVGEIEPLRMLGINVNENIVKMKAWENGIGSLVMENGKLKGTLTEQEKIQARLIAITDATADAQGDLARTIDSPVNAMRIFQQRVEELGLKIGSFIIPYIQKFTMFTQQLIAAFDKIPDSILKLVVPFGIFLALLGPVLMGLGGVMKSLQFLSGTLVPMLQVASPWMLAIAAVALVIYANWDKLTALWGRIKDAWGEFMEGFRGADDPEAAGGGVLTKWQSLGERVAGVWDRLKKLWGDVRAAWDDLVSGFQKGGMSEDEKNLLGFDESQLTEFEEVGYVFRGMADTIESAWNRIIEVFQTVGEAIDFEGIVAKVEEFVGAVRDWFRDVDWAEVAQGISDAFDAVLETLAEIGALVGTVLSPLWESLKEIGATLVESFGPAWASLQESFAEAGPLLDVLKVVLQAIGGLIAGVIVVGLGLLNGAFRALAAVVEPVITVITNLVDFFVNLGKVIEGIFTLDWDMFYEGLEGMAENVKAIWQGLQDAVIGIVEGFVTGIIDFFVGLYDSLVGNSIIPDMIDDIVAWFLGLPRRVLSAIAGLATSLYTKGREFLNRLWDGLKETWNRVVTWFTGLKDKVLTAIGNIARALFNTGKDIISGLWDGLRDKWESVKAWFRGLAPQIPEWKGPKEYDRNLLKPSGRWIMEGLAAGLESQLPKLRGTLEGVAGLIADTDFGVDAPALAGVPGAVGAQNIVYGDTHIHMNGIKIEKDMDITYVAVRLQEELDRERRERGRI